MGEPKPKCQLVALPFDITSEILQHCDCRTLASMAQIDKIHQSTAEHLLYESLVFVTEDFESGCLMKCLKTLSIIPQKAARVRLFDIDLSDHYIDLDDTFYDDVFFPSLGTALIAMSNVDTLILRIDDFCRKHSGVPPQDRFFPIFELANLLGPALRKCTFSPTTMIVPPALHPATWARKHDNLRSLQLHEMVSWLPPINESFIQTYRQWTLDSAYTLTISALVRSETPNFVVAFPIFQPNWSAKPIQALVRKPLLEFKRELKAIHLVISSVGTEQMIGNLNSVAECFPHIQTLRLLVEDGEIYDASASFLLALSALENLICLVIFASWKIRFHASSERRIELVELYALSCPRLEYVLFGGREDHDFFHYVREDDMPWKVAPDNPY